MAHLKSPIWAYFSICETNNSKAVCKTCSERIPRGGEQFTEDIQHYTNLRNHLRRHFDENKKLIVAETAKKESQLASPFINIIDTHANNGSPVFRAPKAVQHKPPTR